MAIDYRNTLSLYDELLVVEPKTTIQLKFPYTLHPDYVTTATTGTGTAIQQNSMVVLQTGASANSSASITSKDTLRYIAGQSCHCIFTALFTPGVTGSTQITGVGDSVDGFFFGYNGTDFGVLHRNNSVDTWYLISTWPDKLDGNGPSDILFNPTKGNIFKIQWQWLGFGNIKFYIKNPTTGDFFVVFEVQYINVNTVPSITNPQLALFSQVSNSSNTTNVTLKNGSLAAAHEGEPLTYDIRNSIGNNKSISTEQNIITLRNNPTFLGKTNKVSIYPDFITISAPITADGFFRLVLNSTIGGTPVFTNINANASVVAYDVAGTTVTGGRELMRFHVSTSSSYSIDLSHFNMVLHPNDLLTVSCTSLGAAINLRTGISWKERF